MGEMGVSGAEVVTPFGDAVSFVNGNASEFSLVVDCL